MKRFVPFLFLLLALGCSTYKRSVSKPAFDDLSGTYTYSGLGAFQRDYFPNPLINLDEIMVPSDVEVIQEGQLLKAKFLTHSGKSISQTLDLDTPDESFSWENGLLLTQIKVPIGDAPVLPGRARHFRGTRIFRAADGNLRIIGFFEEKGWMLFVFPFTDHYDYELVLKRKSAGD